MAFHAYAVAGAILIVHTGDEGLHRFDICLAHSGKFAKLQYPIALQLFGSCLVAHIRKSQAVRKPLASQLCKEGRFSDALRSVQYWNTVKLCAGVIDSSDRRHHRFATDCSCVSSVRRAEVINEQRLHAGSAIPSGQFLQILLYGVICLFSSDRQHSILRLGR